MLRKDFVVDRYGVWQARALGADAILLIVRALGDDLLRQLIAEAGEAGLDALVEVHGSDELDRALDADATLIGVNARDLATLAVDLEASLPLLRRASESGATVVAESGIAGGADVEASGRGRRRRRPGRDQPAAERRSRGRRGEARPGGTSTDRRHPRFHTRRARR